jgi:hypothetical protein
MILMVCVTSQKFQNKEKEFHLFQKLEPTNFLDYFLSEVHSAHTQFLRVFAMIVCWSDEHVPKTLNLALW